MGLFDDMASNEMGPGAQARIQKEMVVAYFKIQLVRLSGGTEDTMKTLSPQSIFEPETLRTLKRHRTVCTERACTGNGSTIRTNTSSPAAERKAHRWTRPIKQ